MSQSAAGLKHESTIRIFIELNVETPDSMAAIVTAQYTELDLTANELHHPAWTKAQPINITRRWSGENARASQYAEARIVWTPQALCVRFDARQTEPLVVNAEPQTARKTIGLWHSDVCEIFIAPDPGQPERYFEFEAAPTGEWVDLAISFAQDLRETDFDFQSGMTAAAMLGEGQTIIAMRIPWSAAIPKPRRGDVWRVNLFRCAGVGSERYLAWQPTFAAEPNFHVPDVFGWLEFV
jgi:hypothetical protein